MANIKAQDLPEKLTKAVPDDRVLMIDSEDYNRLKTQPAEYYRWDDWVSPTVNVIDTPPWQEPAWHTVEITDVNWKKSFFVKDWWWDMEKAVYDKNDNGIVDDAEALGWRPAEDYALKEDVQDHINTKTFYIKWESDLTTAQEIFERFKQGKNPIVIYQNVSFNMSNLFNDRLEFMASKDLPYDNSLCTPACMIYYSWNNVTSVKLRMLTAIDIKTINNETLLWQWNITIKWWAYEAPKIEIKLTPIQTVYKKWTTASISEFKATITKWTNDIESVRFKKDDWVIYIVTEWIKDWWDVVCNCGTALSNLTENTKLTVEVNDWDGTTVENLEIAFVNPFYYGCSDTININNTWAFTEDISKKENKTYGFSPNWEHNTIIYDSSYWELLEIRDENWFRLDSWFTTWTFEEWTVNYRYYTETIETKDNDAVYTFYFTASGWWDNPPVTPTITVDTALSTTSGNPVQNKVITTAMQGKQDILESGVNIKTINGNSLLGWWNIEIQGWTWDAYTKAETDALLADKADKSDTYTKAEINEQMWNKVDSTAYNTAIQDLQDQIDTKASASTTYTKTETDDLLADKQDTLVSWTNIKTINWNSLLGNGNIEIQWWTTISIDNELSATSENPVQNKVIKQALDAKANTTDIPDVSNFATKSELPDMTEYYDKTEVDALIPDVSGFITKDVNDLTNYTTTTAMNTALDGKADKSTTYTKTETDNLLDAKADATDVNTKTFELASFSDLTTWQAILDWYLAWKNPLISHTYSSSNISWKYTLTLSGTTSTTLLFHIPNFYDLAWTWNLAWTNSLNKTKITITFNSNNEVTSITWWHDADWYFLKADENYVTPYTPLYDGSPATKKYVDDSIATKRNSVVKIIVSKSVFKNDPIYFSNGDNPHFYLLSNTTIDVSNQERVFCLNVMFQHYTCSISQSTFTINSSDNNSVYRLRILKDNVVIWESWDTTKNSSNNYEFTMNVKWFTAGNAFLRNWYRFEIKKISWTDTLLEIKRIDINGLYPILVWKYANKTAKDFIWFAKTDWAANQVVEVITDWVVDWFTWLWVWLAYGVNSTTWDIEPIDFINNASNRIWVPVSDTQMLISKI